MKRIRVSYGVTCNLGNYESFRLDMSLERDVDEGETAGHAFSKGYKQVMEEVHGRVDVTRAKALAALDTSTKES